MGVSFFKSFSRSTPMKLNTTMLTGLAVALSACLALGNEGASARDRDQGGGFERDHRSEPEVRDHRMPVVVRDHRSEPEVRDHRMPVVVRDHRSEPEVR